MFPPGENQQGSPRSILEHVQSYEITYPTWLSPRRHRRAAEKEVSLAHLLSSLAGKMVKPLAAEVTSLLLQ